MAPQQYCVRVPLRGVQSIEPKGIVTIPTGATLSIVGQPSNEHLVTVCWDGRELRVFAKDLQDRAAPCDWLPESG
jgi:hypothetical protein